MENLQFAQGIGLGAFAEWFRFIVFEIVWSTVGVYLSLPIIINEDTSKLIVIRLFLPLLNSVSLAPMTLVFPDVVPSSSYLKPQGRCAQYLAYPHVYPFLKIFQLWLTATTISVSGVQHRAYPF